MDIDVDDLDWESSYFEPANEVTWANGRRAHRTYIHKSFRIGIPGSRDFGRPSRYIVKVFDEETEEPEDLRPELVEWTRETLQSTPGGRKQIKIQVARVAGEVREIVIQEVPSNEDAKRLKTLLTLRRDGSARLIELIGLLQHIPVEGQATVRLDDQTLHDVLSDPGALNRLYDRDPSEFARVIENDATADDVVAIAHRKTVVERFRQLLEDEESFEEARHLIGGGSREKVWQILLEENSWILGVGLSGQLLTSWDSRKLEQLVSGSSIAHSGKRTDALLRTNGRISSLVFAEIKHHQTGLVNGQEYRSGCWGPSAELAGAVTQIQQTVYLAARQIGERLADTDPDGNETGDFSYLVRPRSFLIAGNLNQLTGNHGTNQAKYRSFELFRRNLHEPEIVTFDELLARAEWNVGLESSP